MKLHAKRYRPKKGAKSNKAGMKPVHPLTCWRRATTKTTAAFFLLQCTLLLPWAAPTENVELTAQSVHREPDEVLVPPQACREFYEHEPSAAAMMASSGSSSDDKNSHETASITATLVPQPTTASYFWTSSDCVDVWGSWTRTLPVSLQPSYPDRRRLRERASDMRQRGKRHG